MSGTIAVGVEGTEPSRVALRWSMKRAAASGSVVRLVNVVDTEWAGVGTRMLDDMHVDARQLLEREAEYARSLAPGVSVDTELLEGDLMDELIAASQDCDLIAGRTRPDSSTAKCSDRAAFNWPPPRIRRWPSSLKPPGAADRASSWEPTNPTRVVLQFGSRPPRPSGQVSH